MSQAIQRIPGLTRRPTLENDRSKSFKGFCKLNPPNFYRGHDLIASLRWLREVQKKFDTLVVPAEFGVSFAIGQYAHNDHVNKMLKQFTNLRQGSMIVDEYYVRFVKLSQYAYTPESHSRPLVIHFRTNLRPEIRTRFKLFPITTLIETYGTTQKIEANLISDRGTASGYKGKGYLTPQASGTQRGYGQSNNSTSGSSSSYQGKGRGNKEKEKALAYAITGTEGYDQPGPRVVESMILLYHS
ncbi:hypothetical protein PanWU01x14_122440 [Parasponia andersonii]|uniref:Retrotransposon gag domain-containing protein n=1 Tax=Parasponia andersonii TaxID=3476 RepID=A0A2P5CUN3_PARAD|nr:hypothetical protein PanWU01x14_122440 [Parasponia andersonii]